MVIINNIVELLPFSIALNLPPQAINLAISAFTTPVCEKIRRSIPISFHMSEDLVFHSFQQFCYFLDDTSRSPTAGDLFPILPIIQLFQDFNCHLGVPLDLQIYVAIAYHNLQPLVDGP